MSDAKRRMSAYYYRFDPTGIEAIDKVLGAVACAGKAFHLTADWNDECGPYDDHTGATPIEWIQNAAVEAGDEIDRLRTENERLKASEEAYRKTLRGIVRQCNNTGYGSPSVMERMIDRIEDMAIDALGTHRHASKEVND